ncbi:MULTISPECIES: Rrf2 family transcriptional regulator [unclassified Dokdonia]|jgi:Rrf2 family protein|uniref:RrF2 family transcriptional regulator n=1 Tax=unclassified Dokdonia TaxID=2615033 RepID=UPI000D54A6C4|nr:Rrf2 family transcriptional regulator [Dokdonia sp. Dokd-P16]AWH74162.1 transcriptional regulator [Dokdonia sp. Dokd-P16]|tara:strand:- start:39643 stop:40068 length:426 start_codon:yes stop_codon:yes gene_type:complete
MLSRKTKYGIKALTYIAREQREDALVQIGTIAESENISQKFLESIMLTLKKAGFVSSRKGKGGGYQLRREPKDIKMVEVMRVLEGPVAMLPCVSLNYYERCADCKDEDACSVHSLMIQIRDNTLLVLEKNTLADLVAAASS